MINLFVVCKNNFFYTNLRPILLRHKISVSNICTVPELALDQFAQSGADVILLDFNWSRREFSGSQLIQRFLSQDPTSKIIFATTHYEQRVASFSQTAGALGYLYRNVESLNVIVDCIRNVYSGKHHYLPADRRELEMHAGL